LGPLSNKIGSRSFSTLRSSGFLALVNNYSLQIKLGIIAITILVIFFNDIATLGAEALASDYYNYVFVIPFMMAYLVYQKRRVLSAILPLRDDGGRGYLNLIAGISGLFASLMVYVYGIYTTDPLSFHLLALEIFLTCAILLLFNRQTLRTLAVPILLINAALPAAVTFGLSYWYAISIYSTYPAYLVLKFFGLNVSSVFSLNAPAIQLIAPTGTFQFAVGVASSGIYSFVGFTVFALFVAYIATGPIWKRALLFLLGYALLIPINVLREIILITAANFWGIGAFNFFHLTSGFVLITIVTFVLLIIGGKFFGLDYLHTFKPKMPCAYCSQELSRNQTSFCSNCGKFLKSIRGTFTIRDTIAIEAMIIIFLIFFISLAPAYANAKNPSSVNISSNLTPQQALTLLPNVTGYTLSYSGPDVSVQQQLDADAILLYSYSSPNGAYITASVQVLTAYHTPDTSIIQHITNYGLQPYTVYANTNVEIPVNQSTTPLAGGFIAFLIPGSTQIESILWWNLRSLFNFGSYYDYRNVQIWLIGFPQNQSEISPLEQSLLPIASKIASWWEPKLAYSIIQTSLKQSSLPLAGVALFPPALVAGNDCIKKIRARRSNGNSSIKPQERKLLEALNSLKDKSHFGRGTLEEISKGYERLTGQELDIAQASIAMTYLEHLGFVQKKIIDMGDEPVQVWQSLAPSQKRQIHWPSRKFEGKNKTQ
jgi:exosortase/archaeosortase family protein